MRLCSRQRQKESRLPVISADSSDFPNDARDAQQYGHNVAGDTQ